MKKFIVSFSVVSLVFFFSAVSCAHVFCFEIGTTETGVVFDDAYIGNEWTSPGVRRLPGVKYKITKGSSTLADGFAYGGTNASISGCTPDIYIPPGFFTVKVSSYGKPVTNSNGTYYSMSSLSSTSPVIVTHSSVKYVNESSPPIIISVVPFAGKKPDDFTYNESTKDMNWAWYNYASISYTLAKILVSSSLPSSWHLTSLSLSSTVGNLRYQTSDFIISIPRSFYAKLKTYPAHEVGHFIMDSADGSNNLLNKANTALNECSKSNCISNGCTTIECGHRVTSIEYATAAMTEGWANFISSKAWNSTSVCEFFGKEIIELIDCSGFSQFNFIHNNCNDCNNNNCYGLSTELDWMRTFWSSTNACQITINSWLDIFKYWGISSNISLTDCNAYGAISSRVLSNYGQSKQSCFIDRSIENGTHYSDANCNFGTDMCPP